MYKLRKLPMALLAFAMAFCASTSGVLASDGTVLPDVRDVVKRSFKVRPGGTLFIDIDHGNVEVRSGGRDVVQVEVERIVDVEDREKAKALLERHDLVIEQHGDDVTVESMVNREEGLWTMLRSHVDLKVRVYVTIPERFDVDFSTGAGNVSIDNVGGSVNGETGAGNVSVGAVRGKVSVSSGSGNISIQGAEQLVEANTGAGNVEVRSSRGQVRISTGAGNITAYITEQPREESKLTTGAGNVTVYLHEDIGVRVDAEASMGSANTDFPLEVHGKWMSKSFGGAVNGGGPGLHLRAGVGNVSLRKM